MRNIWLSKQEIMALPTSGAAWDTVKKYADAANGRADLVDQDSNNNVCCLAAALVYARTGDQTALKHVKDSLGEIIKFSASGYTLGRALALGRELCAYVISADLIDLPTVDAALDAQFQDAIRKLLTKATTGGPSNLIACQKQRPNNWGMHATASIVAVYAYLGDDAELKAAANIFKGWLGDRTAYAGFTYGGPEKDLSWQADPRNPVGINPKGSTIQGHNVDGMLPDDIRRSGSFTWPPSGSKAQMYSWEGLQGAVVAAQLLSCQGYPAWEWSDKALLRAAKFLYGINWPATGDDTWQPWLLNAAYGSTFPTSDSAGAGKNMGFTAWTHAKVVVKPPVDPPPPPPPDPPPMPPSLLHLKTVESNLTNIIANLTTDLELVTAAIKELGG